jgi:glutaredoxin 3
MADNTSARVKVYTGDFCGYCRAAKRLLDARSVPYEEINVSKIPGAREALVERTGHRTIPVIEIDDELVGGYMELMGVDRAGGLTHLVVEG